MDLEEAQNVSIEKDPSVTPYDDNGAPGWQLTLYTVWIAQVLAMVGFSFVMPFIPFYIRDLGVTDTKHLAIWSGLMISGSGISMSLTAPLWGALADRYGRKPMVQRAMFGGALALGAMGLAKNVRQLFGLRVMQGAITGTVSASVALISSVVPQSRMGFSLGLMQMAVFSGSSIGPLIGGVAAEHLGYRKPFIVTGVLLFLAGLLVLFGAKERFHKPAAQANGSAGSLRDVLAFRGVRGLLTIFLLLNLSGSFVGPIFPLFVEDVIGRHGKAVEMTGLLLAVSGIAAAVTSIILGRLSDRFGHKQVLILCTAVTGLTCIPHAWAQSLGQLLLLRILFGFGAGGMSPALNALVTTYVPRESLGRAYGLTVTASAIGWTIGPALGGWAASFLGFRIPFIIMGSMMLVMALLVQYSSKTKDVDTGR